MGDRGMGKSDDHAARTTPFAGRATPAGPIFVRRTMIQVSRDANHIFRFRMRRSVGCMRVGCCSVGALETEHARPGRGFEDFDDKNSIVSDRHAMKGTPNDSWDLGNPRDRSLGSKDDSFPREACRATTFGESGRQNLGVGRGLDDGILRGTPSSAFPGIPTETEPDERVTMIHGGTAGGPSHPRSPMRCGSRGRKVAVNTTKNDNMQNQLDHRNFWGRDSHGVAEVAWLREVGIGNQHGARRRNDDMRRQRLGRRLQECDLVVAAPTTSGRSSREMAGRRAGTGCRDHGGSQHGSPVENSRGYGEDGQTKSSNLKEANALVITPGQSPFLIWGATDLPSSGWPREHVKDTAMAKTPRPCHPTNGITELPGGLPRIACSIDQRGVL